MKFSQRQTLASSQKLLRFAIALVFLSFASALDAQEQAPGPLAPPPEHKVTRIEGAPPPEAPPSLPPAEIVKRFAQKEDLYQSARAQYSYHKNIRIQEFGADGQPSGEFQVTYEAVRGSDGQLYERALAAPSSTMQYLQFEPDDIQQLFHMPAFPLTTAQLYKYVVTYLSTEAVDEVDCYIFQVRPKTLDRQHPLFDGIVWVDQKYLEVVKTYGKWVTDLGSVHPATLPFNIFETYREDVDGKYWLPNYSRSDDHIKLQDRTIPVRVTIKWSDFKPFSSSPPVALPAANPSPASSTPAPK
jgi:hypothetical protein